MYRGHVQEVDTNSSSPHPPIVWAPAPPGVDKEQKKKQHGERKKNAQAKTLECRENDKDLLDFILLLLSTDKPQTIIDAAPVKT